MKTIKLQIKLKKKSTIKRISYQKLLNYKENSNLLKLLNIIFTQNI